MASYEEAMEALRRADAAGNVEDAKRLAAIAARLKNQRARFSPMKATRSVFRGVSTGLADLAGMPGDIAVAAGRKAEEVLPDPLGKGIRVAAENMSRTMAPPSSLMREVVPGAYGDLDEIEAEYRPFAVGGETIGASAVPSAGMLATGRNLAKRGVESFLARTAGKKPVQFAAVEAASATAGGVGAGVAEQIDPGNPYSRFAGEVIGGIIPSLSSVPIMLGVGGTAINSARAAASPAGRTASAATRMQKVVRDAGEDPAVLAAQLRGDQVSGLTAAQVTGSPALARLENTLAAEARKYGSETEAQVRNAIAQFNAAIRDAAQTGDPDALRQVAQARERYFNRLIETKIALAKQNATRSGEALSPTMPRRDANLRAREVLETALDESRAVERSLWQRIDRAVDMDPSNTVSAYQSARSELLDEENLIAPVEAFMRRAQEGTVTSGDLLRFRSNMLERAREARGQARYADDRRFEMMADGALDDLSALGGPQVDEARAFSRALNDAFSRTAAADTLGVRGGGRVRTEPERTLESAMAGGGTSADVRMGQLEEAAGFTGGRPEMDAAPARATEMRGLQEQQIRDVAAGVVDPLTGKVNAGRLARFRRDNRELLARFPDLDRQLADAEGAQKFVNETVPKLERGQRIANQIAPFAKVANVEDPTLAFSAAIKGKTPVKDVAGLFRLARRGGDAGRAGARAALIDAVVGDDLDVARMRKVLGDGSQIRRSAVANGIFNRDQLRALDALMDQADRFNAARASGEKLDTVLDPISSGLDLLLRHVGTKLGTATSAGSAESLVMAGAGSRAIRQRFQDAPRVMVRDIMIEATQNPKFMADLLERPTSVSRRAELMKSLTDTLKRLGYSSIVVRPAVGTRLLEEETEE